jgi:hypothetical protein
MGMVVAVERDEGRLLCLSAEGCIEKALHLELNGTSNLDILVCSKTVTFVRAVITSKWLQSRYHTLFLSGCRVEAQTLIYACFQNCF